MIKSTILVAYVAATWAADNGRALTPPLGWRSWNLYGADVNQQLIEGIMEGMVKRTRMVDGKLQSLCDVGYCDVGLDDNWQACGSGENTQFHDTLGNPLVNKDRFPDMKAMTDHAHRIGLTAGWYGNNCICPETTTDDSKYYKGDVKALYQYGFDGVKLDGCGAQLDLEQYYEMMNSTGKAITVENCHWGSKSPFEPTATFCPWNFYRTSGDVRAQYASVLANLETTYKYSDTILSRPGCWAYPDMLEVGCQHGLGGADDPGLNPEETRSHFGAWAIVSSPLTLSHDVNNDTITDQIWDVITNTEILAVNQAWHGHPGGPFKKASDMVHHDEINYAKVTKAMTAEEQLGTGPFRSSSFTYLYKPMGQGKVAVLLMNHRSTSQDLLLAFAAVPTLGATLGGSRVAVRDLWAHKDLGNSTHTFELKGVAAHDAAFLMLSVQ